MVISMESKTTTLYPYGDTELWYASGDDWSLPLHVQWRHDRENDKHYGLVMPAVGLYYSQGLRLISLLQVHDIQGRQDCWVIPRRMVEAILHKAPGITALAYYKWNEPDTPAIPIPSVVKINKITGDAATELITHNTDMSNQDGFITYLTEKSGLSRAVVKAVFKAICDNAAMWMLDKRREIDFGMFKIISVPFRANWKEIVACKFKRWKLLEMFRAPNGDKLDKLEEAGVPSALCSMHNIALKSQSGRYRISYTLEAVTTKRFEKVVDDVERSRLACGGTSYVASFEKTVETIYLHLLDSLEGYLHKTNLPFARLLESGNSGHLRLQPTTGNKIKIRGGPIRKLPVFIIPPRSDFALSDTESDTRVVPIPPPGVSKVPDLLQPAEDMRECKGESDVDIEDGPSGNAGVSLLDATKGKADGQPVLSGREAEAGHASRLE